MTARPPTPREGDLDPYRVLGIDSTADQRAIRAAYHARARSGHPDVGGDSTSMVRINAAYELIKDPERRAAWDASRREFGRPRQATAAFSASADPRGFGGQTATRDPRAPSWTGAAGPPPGRPFGSVLPFGLFAGWSLGEIVRRDAGYLAWLSERPEGKPYVAEIAALLAPLRDSEDRVAKGRTPKRGGFRR